MSETQGHVAGGQWLTPPKDRQTFRRVDEFRRSDVFSELGAIERLLGLPERPDTDFKSHADWENYLFGRAEHEAIAATQH